MGTCRCMYIYVCACVYTWAWVYVWVYVYLYMYVCVWVGMSKDTSIYICMCMYMYVYVCMDMCMYGCACLYMGVYICVYVHGGYNLCMDIVIQSGLSAPCPQTQYIQWDGIPVTLFRGPSGKFPGAGSRASNTRPQRGEAAWFGAGGQNEELHTILDTVHNLAIVLRIVTSHSQLICQVNQPNTLSST